MIKQILLGYDKGICGLSDNGELYELKPTKETHYEGSVASSTPGWTKHEDFQWSHVCSSPNDKEKPYFDGEWKTRNA